MHNQTNDRRIVAALDRRTSKIVLVDPLEAIAGCRVRWVSPQEGYETDYVVEENNGLDQPV